MTRFVIEESWPYAGWTPLGAKADLADALDVRERLGSRRPVRVAAEDGSLIIYGPPRPREPRAF